MDPIRGLGPLALHKGRETPDGLKIFWGEIIVADGDPELLLEIADDVQDTHRIYNSVPEQRIVDADVALSGEREVLHDEARELLPDCVTLHRAPLLGRWGPTPGRAGTRR